MIKFLVAKNIPRQLAERIVNFVYNVDGAETGSCSNFKSASEILDACGTRSSNEGEVEFWHTLPQYRAAPDGLNF
jgi:hypothetical protein